MINKKGLTIAEAVISMVLLAIITMGIYGVIMASVRSGKKPDMREDMAFAIESASAKLQGLVRNDKICLEWDPGDKGGCKRCCSVTTIEKGGDLKTCNEGCGKDFISRYADVCGRYFDENASDFVIYSDRQTPAPGVKTPFQPGMDYYIDFKDKTKITRCLLPDSCDKNNSYFFYRVTGAGTTANTLRYNVRFFISCNGQTMING